MRSFSALVLEIARHELQLMLRTRRAVALAAVYLASAAIAGVAYVVSLRFIERQTLAAMTRRGADPGSAAEALDIAGSSAYRELVGFFADVEPSAIDPHILGSMVLPALLWGSLAFLPFLVVLTSFDHVAADLGSRSILYSVLRAPRTAVLLGKVAAQTVAFTVLTFAASATLVATAGVMLESMVAADAVVGTLRVILLLVPFGLCYLGIATFASASVRQPTLALFLAIGVMFLLRVAGWFAHVPADSAYAPLRLLAWVSPAQYHAGLWRAGFTGPLASVGVYLGVAAVFTGLAAWRLEARDL